AKAARRALVRGSFPLGLARQSPPRPAAPRVGLVPADVDRGMCRRHAREHAEATLQDAVAHLVDVARRAARFALEPRPAGLAPVGALVVAAVLDELAVLRPGDRLRVDLELGDRDRVRLALVVE